MWEDLLSVYSNASMSIEFERTKTIGRPFSTLESYTDVLMDVQTEMDHTSFPGLAVDNCYTPMESVPTSCPTDGTSKHGAGIAGVSVEERVVSHDLAYLSKDDAPLPVNEENQRNIAPNTLDTDVTISVVAQQLQHDCGEGYTNAIHDIVKEIETEAEQLFGVGGKRQQSQCIDLNDIFVSTPMGLSIPVHQRPPLLHCQDSVEDRGRTPGDGDQKNRGIAPDDDVAQKDRDRALGNIGQIENRDRAPDDVGQAQTAAKEFWRPTLAHLGRGVSLVSSTSEAPALTMIGAACIDTKYSSVPKTFQQVTQRRTQAHIPVMVEGGSGVDERDSSLSSSAVCDGVSGIQRRLRRIRTQRSKQSMDVDSPKYKEYLNSLSQESRKRVLNKQAAKRSRDKKFKMEIELEQKAKRLRDQQEKLVAEKSRLLAETTVISFRLNKHNQCLVRQVSN